MSLLKRLRMEKGLTQAELASRLEVSPSTVCFWEAGRWLPSAGMIPKLARILGVSPKVIVDAVAPMQVA